MIGRGHADIGMIGVGVMGQNLALNMCDHGFKVAVHDRSKDVIDRFLAGPALDVGITSASTLPELVLQLRRPRKVMLMITAGAPVDAVITQLAPLLESGDVIIDGGNSHHLDTIRRAIGLEEKGLLFVGVGVSGGEEGARHGPSIMPGGSREAWQLVMKIFQDIAAKVEGVPCCDWVGADGAGHYVKMVHNGIEYADMQLIAESYQLMSDALGLSNAEMCEVFEEWNRGKLDSYLVEITRNVLGYKEDGLYILDVIMDSAGQKGTGKWTSSSSLDMGVPLTSITAAVFARFLSGLKAQRVEASKRLTGPAIAFQGDKRTFLDDLQNALYASKIVSYAQGFMLLANGAVKYKWNLDLGGLALMWRGGCIIRSAFLDEIAVAYGREPELANLLLAPYFQEQIDQAQAAWRRVVSNAVKLGVPVPGMSAALAFYDGYRTERLPANLIQAQRDYFGGHTYERVDRKPGEYFHTNWTWQGGTTTGDDET